MRLRVYRSCYSCHEGKILRSEDGSKMVECGLNGRIVQLKKSMSHPSWCKEERKKHGLL